MCSPPRTIGLALAIWVSAGAPGSAQVPVTSFEALAGRLHVGQDVQVTDRAGRELRGKLEKLSDDALVIKRHGLVSLDAGDVRLIRVRDRDSLKNGALVGLAVGGAMASVWCGAAVADAGDVNANVECAEGFIVYPALGALVGLASDAMIPGKLRVIYRAPGVRPPVTLGVMPLLSARTRGFAVSLTF